MNQQAGGGMSDDPEVLRTLLEQNVVLRRAALQDGNTPEAIRIMEESDKLHSRLVALEDPVGSQVGERRGAGRPYDPEPVPNMAAPDMALRGERRGLDENDPRFRATSERDVSRNLGELDAEQDIARVRALRAQQLRSPTAVTGGSANLNARFGEGSPLGAEPDDLPWDRPTQTDPDAPPVGIVPGDRPGRFERRDPGEGIWTGDIRKPRMFEPGKIRESVGPKGRVGTAMERGYVQTGHGKVYLNDPRFRDKTGQIDPSKVEQALRQSDTEQLQRSRGSRARLKEDHALSARARAQGLGLKPPAMHQDTQAGGSPIETGSRAHLTQSRRQEQQQRAFLRAGGRGQNLRDSLSGGGDQGFDKALYQRLLHSKNPQAAAQYLVSHQKNVADTKRATTDSRRLDESADREKGRDEATADYRRDTLDLQGKKHKLQVDQFGETKKAKENIEAETRKDTKPGRLDTYISTRAADPAQKSTETGLGWLTGFGAGVKSIDRKAWERVLEMRDGVMADDPSEEARWDKDAYDFLRSQAREEGNALWTTTYWMDGSEQFADYFGTDANRKLHKIPGWMTRTHLIMLYGHAYQNVDEPKKLPSGWLNDNPEDWGDYLPGGP